MKTREKEKLKSHFEEHGRETKPYHHGSKGGHNSGRDDNNKGMQGIGKCFYPASPCKAGFADKRGLKTNKQQHAFLLVLGTIFSAGDQPKRNANIYTKTSLTVLNQPAWRRLG